MEPTMPVELTDAELDAVAAGQVVNVMVAPSGASPAVPTIL